MTTIRIEDVTEEALEVLRRRAARRRQSLEEYLRSRLIAHARQSTLDEVLDRTDRRVGGAAPLTVTAEPSAVTVIVPDAGLEPTPAIDLLARS